jgi:hypothetical protein
MNPVCKVWIVIWQNIINISEGEIKGLNLFNSFVFDKSLYKHCLIGINGNIQKEMDTVCSHGDGDD